MRRRTVMCRARRKVIAFIITVAFAICFSAPAAALRFGPGTIFGLAALPFHIITHGMRGLGVAHHRTRALVARASVEPPRHAAHDQGRPVEEHAPSAPAQPAAAAPASA